MERRFSHEATTVEQRADGGKQIVGYGAVFHRADDPGTEYVLGPDIVERIMPGAFDATQDVRGLFNHDPSLLLGRTKSGTMRLSVDQRGLRYEIDIPDTSTGRDVAESIRRGDVTGSSFAFTPTQTKWTRDDKRGVDIREIRKVDLFDVGPVVYPAYEAATTGLRSDGSDDAAKSRDEWRSERESVDVRLRLLTLDEQQS